MLTEIFLDIGLACSLLLMGMLLRTQFRIFQRLLLPASVIGGCAGLFLGPNGLQLLPFSDQLPVYPGLLIALVYASLPFSSLTVSLQDLLGRAIDLWAYSSFAILLQWSGAMFLTLLLLHLWWPELHPGFGSILPAGFVGGHGTAAAIGVTFSGHGWSEATSLAMISATGVMSRFSVSTIHSIMSSMSSIKQYNSS